MKLLIIRGIKEFDQTEFAKENYAPTNYRTSSIAANNVTHTHVIIKCIAKTRLISNYIRES